MLFIFKDKISKKLYSHLVFRFKSNICNDIYYGKTIGYFKVRTYEHLGITFNWNKVKKTKKWLYLTIF